MKNYSNKPLLFTLLFCSLSTVAFGLSSCIDRTQEKIPTPKSTQQGFGRAPNPNPAVTPTTTTKSRQHGFGRAPNPNPTATPTTKPTQQGFGRAPNPSSTTKPTQQGFGRAPNPSPSVFPRYQTQ